MNLRLIALSIAIFTFVACNDATGQKKVALKTKNDSLSYAVGAQVAFNLKKDSLKVDVDMIAAGLRDYLQDDTTKVQMKMEQIVAVFQNLSKEIQEKQKTQADSKAKAAKADGEAFLTKNKNEKGVVTLPTGLQYKVLKMGNGPKPLKTDKVKVHYVGKLIDGTEFDSSVKRGEPAEFPVGEVIPGWTEALQLMPVGSKWMLYIPSNLAYGDGGAGGVIPPGAVLTFEVELLDIVK